MSLEYARKSGRVWVFMWNEEHDAWSHDCVKVGMVENKKQLWKTECKVHITAEKGYSPKEFQQKGIPG